MAQTTNLKPHVLQTINHYKQLLQSAHINYEQVIAFGSQVTGKKQPWSDIDLGVVSRHFSTDRHQNLVDLLKARDETTLDIEPHPIHPDDFLDTHDTLAQEIKKYGIPV